MQGHTQWLNLQSLSGMQQSSTDVLVGDNVPPSKKTKVDDDESATDDEDLKDRKDVQAPLMTSSEAASMFLEAAFGTKLENKTRVVKAKAQGTPDSRWIHCTKIDPLVMMNIPPAARTTNRAASRL